MTFVWMTGLVSTPSGVVMEVAPPYRAGEVVRVASFRCVGFETVVLFHRGGCKETGRESGRM